MIKGCSPTTLNLFRIEDGNLYFDGHDSLRKAEDYDFNEGTDDDACFAAECLSGKFKNFVLLGQNLQILKAYVDEEVKQSKSAWGSIWFGVWCNDFHVIGEICKARSTSLFNVVPYFWEDLKTIGKMLNAEPASPTVLPLQLERKRFGGLNLQLDSFTDNIKNFEDTIYLDMAKCATSGLEAFNLVYSSPFDDGFCNRFVVRDWTQDCDVCLVSSDFAEKCFGTLPTSYRMSGGIHLPTEISVTEKFVSETGYKGETVNILISGAHNHALNRFMAMWYFTMRRNFAWTKKTSLETRHTVFVKDGYGFADKSDLEDWRNRFEFKRPL